MTDETWLRQAAYSPGESERNENVCVAVNVSVLTK